MPKINKVPAFALNEAKKYNDAQTPSGQYPSSRWIYDLFSTKNDGSTKGELIKSKDQFVRLIDGITEGGTLYLQIQPTEKLPIAVLPTSEMNDSEKIKLSGDLNDLIFKDVFKSFKTNIDLSGLNNIFLLSSAQDVSQELETDETGIRVVPEEIEVDALFNIDVERNKPSDTFRETIIKTWGIKRYIAEKNITIKLTTERIIPKKIKKVRMYFQNNFAYYGSAINELGTGTKEDYTWKMYHLIGRNLERTYDYMTPLKVIPYASSKAFELELPDAGEYAYAKDCITKSRSGNSGWDSDVALAKIKSTPNDGGTPENDDYNKYGDSSVNRPFGSTGRTYNFKNTMHGNLDYIYFGTYTFKIGALGSWTPPKLKDEIMIPSLGANKFPILKSLIAGTTNGDGQYSDLPNEQPKLTVAPENIDVPNKRFNSAKWLYAVDYEVFDDFGALLTPFEQPWRIGIASVPYRIRKYDSETLNKEMKTILDRKPIFNGVPYKPILETDIEHESQPLPSPDSGGYEGYTEDTQLAILSIPNGLEGLIKEVDISGSGNRSSLTTYTTGQKGIVFNSLCEFKFPTPANYYYNRLKQSWFNEELGSVRINDEDRIVEATSGQPIVFEMEYENILDTLEKVANWVDTGAPWVLEYLDENDNWPEVDDIVKGEKVPVRPIIFSSNLNSGKPLQYKYEAIYAGS